MRYGWQGPCENTVTACAGHHAIGNAARMVADGRCDVVMAGGAEAPFTPTAVAGFGNMTALSNSGTAGRSTRTVMGSSWPREPPFWSSRPGNSPRRAATILGEVLGSASTADAHHITAPSPGGVGAVTCMQLAMDDADITPDQVRHINAHGTSTDKNDAAEAEAVAKVFGTDDSGPLVTSTKGITGHALGAAGALEAVAVLLAMQHGKVPPRRASSNATPNSGDQHRRGWSRRLGARAITVEQLRLRRAQRHLGARPGLIRIDHDASASASAGVFVVLPSTPIRRRRGIRDG